MVPVVNVASYFNEMTIERMKLDWPLTPGRFTLGWCSFLPSVPDADVALSFPAREFPAP
jgi:hypothetical protein